jgi:hypothetical protein
MALVEKRDAALAKLAEVGGEIRHFFLRLFRDQLRVHELPDRIQTEPKMVPHARPRSLSATEP